LHAFTAGDATRRAHGITLIKDDRRMLTAPGHADDIVNLLLATGARAAPALNAGIEVDCHRRMGEVADDLVTRGESRGLQLQRTRPMQQLGIGTLCLRRHVSHEQLKDHALRGARARAVGLHMHAGRGCSTARWGQYPLTVDLDHACTAIAVRAQALLEAQMRDLDTVAGRTLQQRLTRRRLHRTTVKSELNRCGTHRVTSWGKKRSTDSIGLEAACPRPQIEASRIT
jgi:hypothetical protein